MPTDIRTGAFVLGAVLLLVALFGGGIEAFGVKIPSVSKIIRIIAGIVGIMFVAIGLFNLSDRFGQIGLTSGKPELSNSAIIILNEKDFNDPNLDEFVPSGRLLCITTGPIKISNVVPRIDFPGYSRASVICWIGPQQAKASGLLGASLKQIEIQKGTPKQVAIERVQAWAQEMLSNKTGCSSVGKCTGADLAVVNVDGSVSTPTLP